MDPQHCAQQYILIFRENLLQRGFQNFDTFSENSKLSRTQIVYKTMKRFLIFLNKNIGANNGKKICNFSRAKAKKFRKTGKKVKKDPMLLPFFPMRLLRTIPMR
jgi:hypothetical protein